MVVSSRADRRRAWAMERLGRRPDGILVLGRSRGALDDFLREYVRDSGGALGAHRFTLGQLAWQLAAPTLAARGFARLTPLGGEALAALATDLARSDLRALAPVADLPGFSRALAGTIRELRMARVEGARLGALGGPGPDLAALLDAYRRSLERWRLADTALVFERAIEQLRGKERKDRAAVGTAEQDWQGAATVCLDLAVHSPLEAGLLEALVESQSDLAVTVPRGDRRTLETTRGLLGEPLDLDRGLEARNALERAQRYVFVAELPAVAGTAERATEDGAADSESASGPRDDAVDRDRDRSLELFSAGSEGQECVEIARRIRDLAADGVRYDQIAILVRQPIGYLPLVEDALRRAGIPAYFSRGTTRPDPAGRAFLALLACAAEGLPASRFAEYLSLGQVPVLERDGTPPVREVPWVEPTGEQLVLSSLFGDPGEPTGAISNATGTAQSSEADRAELESPAIAGTLPTPSHWERMLVDAAVVGGADRWRRRLRGLDAELRRKIREAGDEDELRRLSLERSLERLGHLLAFALPLVDQLDGLPGQARWGSWLDHLEALAARALRRPTSVLALLADLRPLREVGPVSLAQVRRVLEERLGVLRREPAKRRYGRVFVGALDEAAGRSFEIVFVPGLAEGVFPKRSSEDPLLLDELRKRALPELERQGQRLRAERLLLHLGLGAASHRVVLSYPRVDVTLGRARVPSFYALDVLRAAEGKVPDLKSLARRAAAAGGALTGFRSGSSLEDAIDAAEYDLSVLGDLFHRPPGDARGEGRFLLTVNEPLRRSLHARARRWRGRFTYADGLVIAPASDGSQTVIGGFAEETVEEAEGSLENEAAREAEDELRRLLAAEAPECRSYSPTALQHYAACPYRFFLQAVLRLRPREDRTGFEQLDPLTRGSIFHQVQFELQCELRERGHLPVTADNVDDVFAVADEVFESCQARFTEELAPAIPRVWRSELESLRNDLRGWLRQVADRSGPWVPTHFELAFGLEPSPDRDPASVEEPLSVAGGRKVRGAIDLVEADPEGGRLRVTDHKTGRARRERDLVIAGGSVLQPLIYALAAERLLAAKDEPEPSDAAAGAPLVDSGRLYYCTQRGEYSSLEVPLNPEGRRAVEQVFEEVEKALEDGFLPAAPQEDACRWCDYRPVCGPYEEQRSKRKDRTRLESLNRLRRHR